MLYSERIVVIAEVLWILLCLWAVMTVVLGCNRAVLLFVDYQKCELCFRTKLRLYNIGSKWHLFPYVWIQWVAVHKGPCVQCPGSRSCSRVPFQGQSGQTSSPGHTLLENTSVPNTHSESRVDSRVGIPDSWVKTPPPRTRPRSLTRLLQKFRFLRKKC